MSYPDGLQAITPYFTVKDTDALMAFVKNAFGAEVIKEERLSDGTLKHARARINGSIIMMNGAMERYPANVSQMHLYGSDVKASYILALKAGGISMMEPNLRPHGDWMAGITDPCGNIWWLAAPVE